MILDRELCVQTQSDISGENSFAITRRSCVISTADQHVKSDFTFCAGLGKDASFASFENKETITDASMSQDESGASLVSFAATCHNRYKASDLVANDITDRLNDILQMPKRRKP